MRNMGLLLSLLLALTGDRALAQGNPTPLSPAEAYKAAMAPLNAARAQPDDLTDADKFALGIGMAQASRDCLALSGDTSAFATDGKELLALSELCLFGQQYEPARATLVKYLALPQPPERKLALVLLIRALIGLKEPGGAELQVDSLLRDYPYDAQIHFAIDQVIDALEAESAHRNNGLHQALQRCTTQNAVTLPLLTSGKALEGKDISASPSVLFADATRCAALAEGLGESSAQETMHQLTAIVQQPSWAGTADLAPMQAALARQTMVGARVPLSSVHGHVLSNNTLLPRTVPLTRGTALLVPFVLWSPSALDVVGALARSAPQQPIYAITSWSANTGRDDAPSNPILTALRLWQQTLPPHVSMLIVPDVELSAFHADSFPAGIVIRDGVVRSNSVLSSPGAERMLLRALTDPAERP
jgi:hypothetical protein